MIVRYYWLEGLHFCGAIALKLYGRSFVKIESLDRLYAYGGFTWVFGLIFDEGERLLGLVNLWSRGHGLLLLFIWLETDPLFVIVWLFPILATRKLASAALKDFFLLKDASIWARRRNPMALRTFPVFLQSLAWSVLRIFALLFLLTLLLSDENECFIG